MLRLTVAAMVAASMLTPVATVTTASTIDWRSCSERFDCGSVVVPVDWRDRAAGEISIGLAKLPATNPATKKGTLLVNLGGPGASIQNFMSRVESFADLARWFDVVAFDPRGFGRSAGVTCPAAAPDITSFLVDPLKNWDAQLSANQRYEKRCRGAVGALAGHLDSWQVAHDMEAIRREVAEPTLNYYGNSYGTVYGQTYASLFPTRVKRMYLDSVVDHTQPSEYLLKAPVMRQTREILPRISRWCVKTPSCALRGRDVLAVWDRVHAKAQRHPIPASGSKMTMSAARLRSRSGDLLFEPLWPATARALAKADKGDSADFMAPRPSQPMPRDLLVAATCADRPAPSRTQQAALMARLRRIEPRFAWQTAIGTAAWCVGLPRLTTFPPTPINAPGAPPLLLANGSYDTGTAPSEGQHVASRFPGSRWFTATGYHSLYAYSGSKCVRGIVERYLTMGALPAIGTVCTDVPPIPPRPT